MDTNMRGDSVTPFNLPTDPIDGYTVQWWRVDESSGTPNVIPCSATYYVNGDWVDIFGRDDRPPGCNFVDQWLMRSRDHFVSRVDGWNKTWRFSDWRGCYGNEADAYAVAREQARKRADRLFGEAKQLWEHSYTLKPEGAPKKRLPPVEPNSDAAVERARIVAEVERRLDEEAARSRQKDDPYDRLARAYEGLLKWLGST